MLSRASPADPAATLPRLGRHIRWLVLLYLLVLLLGLGTTLVWPGLLAYQPALAGSGIDPAMLGLGGRLAACAALTLPALPLLAAVREALLLCRLMSGGQIFTAEVPRRLRRMGLALVASAALQPVGGALLSLAVSSFAGGPRRLALPLSPDDVGVAVIGAVLIAIAAAAREAVRLADENAHFI
ncbi:MAG TPA: DUF2975 domain-containing protein [Stellaceae bacterium]|nr:DUF2975 domain-containing protein [Stellaceae bacterium]